MKAPRAHLDEARCFKAIQPPLADRAENVRIGVIVEIAAESRPPGGLFQIAVQRTMESSKTAVDHLSLHGPRAYCQLDDTRMYRPESENPPKNRGNSPTSICSDRQ